jgi:cobalt/nickel transport system permease protein
MTETTVADGTRSKRRTIGLFLGLGLAVALILAFFVSPFASSKPDGLEKVSIDKGFDETAEDHALADAPLADYGVEGVDNARLSTGLAGIIGVALCFAVGAGVFLGIRALRSRPGSPPTPAPASPSG